MLRMLLFALTVGQWQADITYLQNELPKRHPNLFFQYSRTEFNAALEDIKAKVASRPGSETLLALQQVVARVGDAHTEVATGYTGVTYFPLRLYRFDDGIFVTKTDATSRAAWRARLIAIDGVDAEQVYARVATMISHENESWVAARFASHLLRADTLHFLGITAMKDRARFTFESEGRRFELDLSAGAPLPKDPLQNYWQMHDADRRLLFVKYNVCANDPAKPFSTFAGEVLATADREDVGAFVIDLRNNTGGNSSIAQPLINGLAQRPHLRVYVLIGRATFSSGMLNAYELRTRARAILVGEPTGGKPNSYGEVKSFTLPATGISVYHSTRLFRIMNGDPEAIVPDLALPVLSEDYFTKRDTALDAILSAGASTLAGESATLPARD